MNSVTFDLIQDCITENKIRKGFNTTEVGPEIIHLAEELGELALAHRYRDHDKLVNACGDLIVYAIGLLGILGHDAGMVVMNIVSDNAKRRYQVDGAGHEIDLDKAPEAKR